jgi:hypothetical protein
LGVYVRQSLAHAGNVPIIYNPIPPQFHLVFDDQFTSIHKPAAIIPETFFTNLFEKAAWEYKSDSNVTLEDYYTFDNYWGHPPLIKQKRHILGSSSLPKPAKIAVASPSHLPMFFTTPFHDATSTLSIKIPALSGASLNSPTLDPPIKTIKTQSDTS